MHNVLAFCVPMTCLPLQNMILQNCCHIKFYNIKMIFVIQVCALILCRVCMPKFMHECDPKVDSYIQDWLDMCVNFFILCWTFWVVSLTKRTLRHYIVDLDRLLLGMGLFFWHGFHLIMNLIKSSALEVNWKSGLVSFATEVIWNCDLFGIP